MRRSAQAPISFCPACSHARPYGEAIHTGEAFDLNGTGDAIECQQNNFAREIQPDFKWRSGYTAQIEPGSRNANAESSISKLRLPSGGNLHDGVRDRRNVRLQSIPNDRRRFVPPWEKPSIECRIPRIGNRRHAALLHWRLTQICAEVGMGFRKHAPSASASGNRRSQ